MNYHFLVIALVFFTGCTSIAKDIFEIAATPEELASMSQIDVCKHLGYSQWRNQPRAYLDAKSEAVKRIKLGQVSSEDCVVFAKMAIRNKEKSSAQLDRMMRDLNSK